MVDLALRSYFVTPASESKLTDPDEVHEAIRGLKVSKALGPNGIPNRALKRLPQRVVSLLAQIFPSRKPTLLVSYLESYLNYLQRWLSEWRIAINVCKSTSIIFACAGRRFFQPRPVTLFGEPIQWVDTIRYLRVNLGTRPSWSPHIDQVRKRAAQMMGMLGPLPNRKSDLSVRNGVLLYKQLIRPVMDYACPAWRSAAHTHVR